MTSYERKPQEKWNQSETLRGGGVYELKIFILNTQQINLVFFFLRSGVALFFYSHHTSPQLKFNSLDVSNKRNFFESGLLAYFYITRKITNSKTTIIKSWRNGSNQQCFLFEFYQGISFPFVNICAWRERRRIRKH